MWPAWATQQDCLKKNKNKIKVYKNQLCKCVDPAVGCDGITRHKGTDPMEPRRLRQLRQ